MSTGNGGDPQLLELDIYNLPFRLRAPADEHERLRRAARHVDQVMRELVAGQPSADTTRLAIQAAFLVSTEYYRNMDEAFAGGSDQANPVGRRMDDVLLALEQALSGISTVLPSDGGEAGAGQGAGQVGVGRVSEPVREVERESEPTAVAASAQEPVAQREPEPVMEPVMPKPVPVTPAPVVPLVEPRVSHGSEEAPPAPRKRSHFSSPEP